MGAAAAAVPVIKTIGTVLGALGTARAAFGGQQQPQTIIQQPAQPAAPAPAEPEPFTPERPLEAVRPESLSELAAFAPQQERSALATQGLNVGLGTQESAYYRNLLQRSLIGEGGQVTQDQDFLLPVEQQYFRGQGINVEDPLEFLRGIR